MRYSFFSYSKANVSRINEAERFADKYLIEKCNDWDFGDVSPEPELRRAIRDFAPTVIKKNFNGHAESFSTLCGIYEHLASRDLGFTCALAVHMNVTLAVSLSPNTKLRDRYLPKLMSGESIGAFMLTEPEVGSDATAIKTIAEAEGDNYKITGNKAWVTNGKYADVLLAFCQTEPGSGSKGIAAFILDREAAGVSMHPALDLAGSGAMGTTDASFESVEVSRENLAFPPGQAFKAAMHGINIARLGVAAMCNGALFGALSSAICYAEKREVFGAPLIKNQGMQWILADVATELECNRSITLQAAQLFDDESDATVLTAHAKKRATKTTFDSISQCMRAMGANGIKRSNNLARQLISSRVAECMDGTGEILNIIISRNFKK